MSIDIYIPKHPWSPPCLAPDDLPEPLEDDMMVEEEEFSATEENEEQLSPHNFVQYCQHSRQVARLSGTRPAYIGYAFIPQKPHGVCH